MNVLDIALNLGVAAVTVAVMLCAWRLLRGPEMTDRLLALDTLYMNAVALIVLLGIRWNTALLFEAPCWWPCWALPPPWRWHAT